MKVTAFNGSPRLNGNTAKLIDAILTGAAEINMSTERIDLSKMYIKPCIACDNCKREGECVQKDDFLSLVDKMKESDVIVFGTPIYWVGPTAQFKTFFDRFYGVYSSGIFKEKIIVLVTPFESKDEKMPRYTIGMIKHSMEWIGIKSFKSFTVPGVVNKDDVIKLTKVMEKAKNIIGELIAAYKEAL